MKLLNFTPHDITLYYGGQAHTTIKSSGIARCEQSTETVGEIFLNGNIPITETTYGGVSGLPSPQKGTFLIVSRIVSQALPERTDLLVPNDLVRDEQGNVIGCSSLSII